MTRAASDPEQLLWRGLESGRVHSAYLLSGAEDAPRVLALRFVRALVCEGDGARPCETCRPCRLSSPREEISLDGSGRKGPLYRHVGDHPDLLWIERGPDDTRVRIGQVRAVQSALRLRSSEAGWRAAVIADAEWLNQEAQNALLRLLEEPPARTTLVLVSASAAGLLATVRSRCQRVVIPTAPRAGREVPEAVARMRARLDELERRRVLSIPSLLDWAEEVRGDRATAAEATALLLETASDWLRARVQRKVRAGRRDVRLELDAFDRLKDCRRALRQRNANPQMVVERALLALREAVAA